MTPEILEQVHTAVPSAPAISPGACTTWLNLDTGARILHVMFGSGLNDEGWHGIFYRSPAGELLDVAPPVTGRKPWEMKLDNGTRRNEHRWREADHAVERALGLREDEFEEPWPSR